MLSMVSPCPVKAYDQIVALRTGKTGNQLYREGERAYRIRLCPICRAPFILPIGLAQSSTRRANLMDAPLRLSVIIAVGICWARRAGRPTRGAIGQS